jgi:hypothetical protein
MNAKDKDTIEQFKLIYDCLLGIAAVHDNNDKNYNSVINCLIDKAMELVEEGLRELHKRNGK